MVGHHDRTGLDEVTAREILEHVAPSRGGCSQDALRSTGGAGLFYCFASN